MDNVTFYNLVMTFKNESGKNSQITLKNVRADITAAEAKTTMATILASNIFLTPQGNLVAVQSAELVAQTTTELGLA